MRSPPLTARSRTRGQRTATAPMPVMISRSGRCPWRTSRRWPSSVSLSAWPPRKPATSASTACANSARAPLRNTSVNGAENVPGGDNLTILSWVTAYHSFSGEVEASNTPTIRRLTPSRRHQLPRITLHKEARQSTKISKVAKLPLNGERTRLGVAMETSLPDEKRLTEAFSIIENTPEIEVVIGKLRDLLNIDHVVYHSSKFGAS